MRRIPVTRNFDPTQPIGYLTLRDDVEIPVSGELCFAYRITEQHEDGTPASIVVESASILPEEYTPSRKKAVSESAIHDLMALYDHVESLGNFEKKVVGNMGFSPGYETSDSLTDACERIRRVLVFHGEDKLVAWFDEMHTLLVKYNVEVSRVWVWLKEQGVVKEEYRIKPNL